MPAPSAAKSNAPAAGGGASYHPLTDDSVRTPIGVAVDTQSAVKVTFLGNTTLVVQDAKTTVLLDGFVSRPGRFRTVFGRVGPCDDIIEQELTSVGVHKVDAVLVGHAHHDHALDATAIADRYGAKAFGSASFGNVYKGSHVEDAKSTFVPIPTEGGTHQVDDFTIQFVPSAHVAPDSLIQRLIDGETEKPLRLPAHVTRLKCGDVFALHIRHPQGAIVATTTAGALPGKLRGLTPPQQPPPVLFLAIGYLSKEPPARREAYWQNTVEAIQPDVIVPVHWDDFTKKLSEGLQVPPRIMGDTRAAMDLVKTKAKAGNRQVRIMDVRETLYLHNRKPYIPAAL